MHPKQKCASAKKVGLSNLLVNDSQKPDGVVHWVINRCKSLPRGRKCAAVTAGDLVALGAAYQM